MLFIGIDTGLDGAVALVDDPFLDPRRNKELKIEFLDIPTRSVIVNKKPRRRINFDELAKFFRSYALDIVSGECEIWLEQLWGFGAAESGGELGQFSFAAGYGGIDAVLEVELEFDGYYLITPASWQNILQKPKWARSKNYGYEASKKWNINKILELYPHAGLVPPGCRVPGDGRADALCIAHAGRIKHIARIKGLTKQTRKARSA